MVTIPSDGPDRDTYGVLVGWEHADCAGMLDLRLQAKQPSGYRGNHELEAVHIVMTQKQAALPGNYLFHVAGQPPPRKCKGLQRRWFGQGLLHMRGIGTEPVSVQPKQTPAQLSSGASESLNRRKP